MLHRIMDIRILTDFFKLRDYFIISVCFVNIIKYDFTNGTHQEEDYLGTGYVRLNDTRSHLTDTEDFGLLCLVISPIDIPVTLDWHWRRDNQTHDPDYYFTWSTVKNKRGNQFEYTCNLLWNSDITDIRKRTASGIIYAAGSHDDDTTESISCSDIPLTIVWPPTISTVIHDDTIISDTTSILKCDTSDTGNPESSVVWLKDGRNYTGPGSTDRSLNLLVTNAHDGSSWECYYYNMEGKGKTSNASILNVNWKPDKPTLNVEPEDSDVTIGQKVTLTCKLDNKGKPQGQIVWLKDSTELIGSTYRDGIIEFFVNRGHNETEWCCYYNNSIDKGETSVCKTLSITSTIPKPGELNVISKTATSLNISIDNSKIDLDIYKFMNVSWRSNTSTGAFPEIVNSNIAFKIFTSLEPATYYTVQFAFIHDDESGQFREISDSTDGTPVSDDPLLTREWLSAKCTLKLLGPVSDKKIVCEVCHPDGTNCINEMKIFPAKQITKRSIQEEEVTIIVNDDSFSRRLVNVTVYDRGVLVYDYSDNIDAPVAAIVLIVLGAVLIVAVIIIIIVIIIKQTGKKKPRKEVEEEISPYGHANPAMMNQSRTGTGHETKAGNAPPVISVVNKGKPLAPIAASPADGDVYSQVDWSKKTKRPSLKGLPMSKKAIDKITFSKNDGSINMHLEVSKKFTGEIEIDVCRDGDRTSKSKKSKQNVGGTKNVIMVLPIKDTSQDKYTISMKFIAKGQMVQEVDLTYPYEQNAVHVTVMNDAYVTSGTDVKASEMPEYPEVNKSKKAKGSEMPIYSEVNKPKKKKKAAEEQPYEDVETKNQSSHNERSTNAVSPSNAEVAVEGVPPHPPRKGTPKEGVMYAELDLNNSGPPRLLPRLGSKSPALEPVVYADVRPG